MDERNDPPTEQRTCPECQEPIGDTDTICPHCGATLVGG
jgi:predicted amidophosphoribosyltransferase